MVEVALRYSKFMTLEMEVMRNCVFVHARMCVCVLLQFVTMVLIVLEGGHIGEWGWGV